MAGLEIQRVADIDHARSWHAVDVAAFDADYVGLPADPLEELLPQLDGDGGDERVEHLLASVDGRPVAIGQLGLPLLDNTSAATIEIRVHPAHRRRGHGRALLTDVLSRVRDHGRTRVFAEAAEPLGAPGPGGRPPGPAFAEAAGARPVLTEVRRMLDLTGLHDDRLAGLRVEAATYADGYTVVQWVGPAPADLHDDLAVLMGRMSTDPPLEDMEWEPEVWDAARYRMREALADARGRRRFSTAARHDASGRLVGYTDIAVNTSRPEVGYQWDTIVVPDHRGHRLGLLVKAANLELLRSSTAGVRLLNTWNAEVNAHMISINEALGFRPMERWREWQLDLAT